MTGPSGSGKTYSSLLIAKGLCGRWDKVCLIDTENGSADLYAHLGDFNVISMKAPYSPEKYINALELCSQRGMEAVVIDSISHCWEFLVEAHSNMVGNSFANWAKITPRHNSFIQSMLRVPFHIVATMRTKTDYVLNQKDNKYVPEKVGLKTIQRDGVDYEFTLVFDLDIKHHASASKDRTNMFIDKPQFTITEDTGKKIMEWSKQGEPKEFAIRIRECKTMKELLQLYKDNPGTMETYKSDYATKKAHLLASEALLEGQLKTQENGKA
ncbi:AAA family ATPase [bacterium]|nr:AAA family ATPase [bacterium]